MSTDGWVAHPDREAWEISGDGRYARVAPPEQPNIPLIPGLMAGGAIRVSKEEFRRIIAEDRQIFLPSPMPTEQDHQADTLRALADLPEPLTPQQLRTAADLMDTWTGTFPELLTTISEITAPRQVAE